MAKKPDIRVLIGVEGDVGINSGSGKLISDTLEKISKNISSQKTPQIAFTVNTQATSENIQKQINKLVNDIEIKPIDLNIKITSSNQSSIGSFTEDEYRKLIESTKGKKTKANIIAHIQEKQGLADLVVQKEKDVEATKKQENSVKDLSKAIQFLGSFDEEKIFSQSDNLVNKLGRSDLLPQFEALKSEASLLRGEIKKIKGDLGDLSFDDLAKKMSGSKDTDEFKDITERIKNYSKAILEFQKGAGVTGASFNKDLRNADNGKLLDSLILKITKFEKVNDKFKNNSGLATEFERIKNALNGLKLNGNFSKVDIDKLDRQFSEFKTNVVSLGQEGQTTFGKLRAQMEKLGVYFGASAVMMGAWRQVKNMVSNVIELDTAMTELKKVTDETDSSYTRFLNNAENRSKNLGSTLVDTVTATADFARLGYSISEAEGVSDAALVYKNVGDGIQDINEASESIVSTMKAFGVAASDAMTIVDRFNEVGNNFAISSKGVGEGLKRSASALHTAGNDINESIALIVAGNEVVQDADVVGTALKTSALRLTSSRGELEELGEDAEGAAESITKLQTQLLNLTKGKVDIMLDQDNFKSTYQIMLEMSKVWSSMTQKNKMDALELMFGKRTANIGASIIENMSTAEKVLETSMNSAGSALSENEKVLESVQGKANVFKAQFEALSNTIVDSELIKGTYDVGTGMLGALTWIIDNLGAIPTLVTVAAGSLSALTNKGRIGQVLVSQYLNKYALLWLIGDDERVYSENGAISKSHIVTSLKWCA